MNQPSFKRLSPATPATEQRLTSQLDDTAAAGQWLDTLQSLPADTLEKVQSAIRSKPLTCLAIAAGVGILAGIWRKRR